jgi:hypothetical protein
MRLQQNINYDFLFGQGRIKGRYQPTENERRSIHRLIERLTKGGARVSYHARRWQVHVASAFPLAHHYKAVLAYGS